jgi:hypothetical protein
MTLQAVVGKIRDAGILTIAIVPAVRMITLILRKDVKKMTRVKAFEGFFEASHQNSCFPYLFDIYNIYNQ